MALYTHVRTIPTESCFLSEIPYSVRAVVEHSFRHSHPSCERKIYIRTNIYTYMHIPIYSTHICHTYSCSLNAFIKSLKSSHHACRSPRHVCERFLTSAFVQKIAVYWEVQTVELCNYYMVITLMEVMISLYDNQGNRSILTGPRVIQNLPLKIHKDLSGFQQFGIMDRWTDPLLLRMTERDEKKINCAWIAARIVRRFMNHPRIAEGHENAVQRFTPDGPESR